MKQPFRSNSLPLSHMLAKKIDPEDLENYLNCFYLIELQKR